MEGASNSPWYKGTPTGHVILWALGFAAIAALAGQHQESVLAIMLPLMIWAATCFPALWFALALTLCTLFGLATIQQSTSENSLILHVLLLIMLAVSPLCPSPAGLSRASGSGSRSGCRRKNPRAPGPEPGADRRNLRSRAGRTLLSALNPTLPCPAGDHQQSHHPSGPGFQGQPVEWCRRRAVRLQPGRCDRPQFHPELHPRRPPG